MDADSRVLVLGHNGLVGSALMERLSGQVELQTVERTQLDLREQSAVRDFFQRHKPEYVFLAAAKVGGILANATQPADFIYDNLMIAANVLDGCLRNEVRKVLVLGSTCIYPKHCEQPIKEEALLSGPLEPSNQWYATAKIAAIKLAQAFRAQHGLRAIVAMPTNLYGLRDRFCLESAHVLPALLHKMHLAKMRGSDTVEVWGTGEAYREFLHADDLARALILLMREYDDEQIINVGCGRDLTIASLAKIIQEIVGYRGELRFDPTKPDGPPRKLTDSSKIFALGWRPQIPLVEGIQQAYQHYLTTRQVRRLENLSGL